MSAIVIGAGQAGLSVSHELEALGVEHVVLERAKPGQAWRDRWSDSPAMSPAATEHESGSSMTWRIRWPSLTNGGPTCAPACARSFPPKGFGIPDMPVPPPFRSEPVDEVSLRDVGAVVLAAGFRPDYCWIDGEVCDELGFPVTLDGSSLVMPGLYSCGVHFMRARRSALMFGVGRDAAIVAKEVAHAAHDHGPSAVQPASYVTPNGATPRIDPHVVDR